jgi:3-hydroxyacyl-CoA dehydrogenase/enoyl-CoA hydratase/3-hydroxybutyryl-CoA epimerase
MGKVWDTLAPRNLELGPLAAPAAAGESSSWRNWRLARDEDDIAWLALDKAGANAKTLCSRASRKICREAWCCAPQSRRASSPAPTSANFAA